MFTMAINIAILALLSFVPVGQTTTALGVLKAVIVASVLIQVGMVARR